MKLYVPGVWSTEVRRRGETEEEEARYHRPGDALAAGVRLLASESSTEALAAFSAHAMSRVLAGCIIARPNPPSQECKSRRKPNQTICLNQERTHHRSNVIRKIKINK